MYCQSQRLGYKGGDFALITLQDSVVFDGETNKVFRDSMAHWLSVQSDGILEMEGDSVRRVF